MEIVSSQAWAQQGKGGGGGGGGGCENSNVMETTSAPTTTVYAGYSKNEVDKDPGSPGTSTVSTTTTTATPAAKNCEPVGTRTESTYTDGPGQSPFENKDSTCEATGTLTCP